MNKKVKVTVTGLPVTSISTPLTMGTHGPVIFSVEDIFKCIVCGAKVVEVLANSEIPLTLSNYNKNNEVSTVVEEPQPIVEEAPPEDNYTVEEPEAGVTVEETVTSEEVTTDTAQEAEGTESPEHWLPPQRTANEQQPRNNNNSNKKKK